MPARCPPGWRRSRCASSPLPTGPTAIAGSRPRKALGFRVTVDDRNEKIGKKIRDAQMEKIPYMLIVGDRDVENGTVSPRHRADGDLGAMPMEQFTALLKGVVDGKEKK